MEDWIKDVRYVLLQCNYPTKENEKDYLAAYEVWKAAWTKFRMESGVVKPLNSDGFKSCDEMGVVFYKNECVGFASFTYGEMTSSPMIDNGWFQAWDEQSVNTLKSMSQSIFVCSQFTISPKFTGKDQVVRWKDIVYLCLQMRFLCTDYSVMAAHLNLIKGMNKVAGEDSGATVINERHLFDFHGQDQFGQLVAYEKSNIMHMLEKKDLIYLCERLWTKFEHRSYYPLKIPGFLKERKSAA